MMSQKWLCLVPLAATTSEERHMKINVPFIYEALVIMPRCRKPILLVLKETVEIEIKEVPPDSLPVAFKVGEFATHWDGSRLWSCDQKDRHGKSPDKVLASTVKHNTESGDYHYSCANDGSPFANFWRHTKDTMSSRHNIRFNGMTSQLHHPDITLKSDAIYREWVDDNRGSVLAGLQAIAEDLLICGDYIYHPAGEPRYLVVTFGMGNNHGGTAMFIEDLYNDNIPHSSYFSALDYEKACAFANTTARDRGDNKSIPVSPNCGHIIEVLIPDAVRVNPAEDHGDGCSFISSIEAGIRESGAVGGLLAMCRGISNPD